MSKPYRPCPYCGNHLDHGEQCTCNKQPALVPKERPAERPKGYRYEICTKCKKTWQVCADKVIPPGGYRCPHCAHE